MQRIWRLDLRAHQLFIRILEPCSFRGRQGYIYAKYLNRVGWLLEKMKVHGIKGGKVKVKVRSRKIRISRGGGEGNRNAQYIPLEVGKRYISRDVYVNINQTIILVHLNLF